MSTRFQIKDNGGNLLTLRLSGDLTDPNGNWLPDDNTKVRSGSDWNNNPYEAIGQAFQTPFDAVLYTIGDDGVRIAVMKMAAIIDFIGYEDSGTGTLYASGAIGTFQAGDMTWKKL
jgi:hypothetical protein